ncbi:hypothetical protein ACJZ2D_003714 [Fusarium nematophilum]
MSCGIFTRLTIQRVFAGGAVVTVLGAEIQFNTSYGFIQNGQQLIKAPEGWKACLFNIRNDYPTLSDIENKGVAVAKDPTLDTPIYVDPVEDAPWLNIDFKRKPMDYCAVIKEYCWEENVNNDFVLQDNRQRRWYHAPWMHWNQNGREPLNGLTFERPTPRGELAKTQQRQLQIWACGYYNEAGSRAKGAKPTQSWINPAANEIRKRLGGTRPDWGWLGRMNGPADNVRSACASCHSVSEHDDEGPVKMVPNHNDGVAEKMRFFRNIPAGQPFNKGKAWGNKQEGILQKSILVIPHSSSGEEADIIKPPAAKEPPPPISGDGKEGTKK